MYYIFCFPNLKVSIDPDVNGIPMYYTFSLNILYFANDYKFHQALKAKLIMLNIAARVLISLTGLFSLLSLYFLLHAIL